MIEEHRALRITLVCPASTTTKVYGLKSTFNVRMPRLEDFQAWVSVDDRPLQEYGVTQSEDGSQVTCWIVSEEGKAFTILWRDAVRSQASMGRTFVDGVKCGVPKGINQKGYKKDSSKENDTACQKGAPSSAASDRLFVFAKVELTDDDMYLASDGSEGLGEIKLEISYIQKKGVTQLAINPSLGEGKIHETRKQLAPHRTRLGTEVQGERKPVLTVKSKGKPKKFIFKYRPKEILKAIGIISNDETLIGQFETEHIDLTEELDGPNTTNNDDRELLQVHMADDVDMVDDAQVMSQLLDDEDVEVVPDTENTAGRKVVVLKQECVIKHEFQEDKTQIKREESRMDVVSTQDPSPEMNISNNELFVKEEEKKPKIEVKTEIKTEHQVLFYEGSKRLKKTTSLKQSSFQGDEMILDLTK
ncbi:hypothetical protein CPB83DRAFT_844824 [Crepidotus variabilis]|uniref:DUF7918 domain-containing protein n=1 Tax=Crepidotus variabilis TaxID=179855 RepID=A0A9P6ESC0_9AGAR|nr:hypothetical protein CPB83DRAFT_844824 [Crepidotus variabilis]